MITIIIVGLEITGLREGSGKEMASARQVANFLSGKGDYGESIV